jgi:hypothetical protein
MRRLLSPALFLALFACGQDPSFVNRKNTEDSSADSQVDDTGAGGQVDENGVHVGGKLPGEDGEMANGSGGSVDDAVILPGGGDNGWMPDWADNDDTDGGVKIPGEVTNGETSVGTGTDGTHPPTTTIPGADDDDLDALHKCLSKWQGNPFNGTQVNNFRRIAAAVTVGGFGNAVNDTEETAAPFLILIDAGVNVGGAPTYQLLNPNGYYCMKVNVNVSTAFTINLHCNARLADSKVNVNVGSTQNDTTSDIGVHVLSDVVVNAVRPEGDKCLR